MSDRGRNLDASSDDNIWAAIGQIRQVVERSTSEREVEVDFALKQLRAAILDPKPPASRENQSVRAYARSIILRLQGRSEGTEACIEWLRRTGRFTETEIGTIRRINLFVEQNSGQVIMRRNGMDLATAAWSIAFLSFLTGIVAGWAIFTVDRFGMPVFFVFYAIGTIMGALISVLLDRSFRFVRVRNKISQLAPWL